MKIFIALISFLALLQSFTATAGTPECRCYGLYVGQKIEIKDIDMTAARLGRAPCAIMLFADWDGIASGEFKDAIVSIEKTGAVPVVTLEPWIEKTKKGSLRDILAGKYDDKLKLFGEIAKNLGGTIYVRFAHEMNGNWYPWAGDASLYVDAYRYVHARVVFAGGTNVLWVWSVNADNVPSENFPAKYYPGDKYVDAIGVDGYNWGINKTWKKWRTFDDVFSAQLRCLHGLYPSKPIFITETASADGAESKALWITDLFNRLSTSYDYIRLIIWFDVNKEVDWRIESSGTNSLAFKNGVAAWGSGKCDLSGKAAK